MTKQKMGSSLFSVGISPEQPQQFFCSNYILTCLTQFHAPHLLLFFFFRKATLTEGLIFVK